MDTVINGLDQGVAVAVDLIQAVSSEPSAVSSNEDRLAAGVFMTRL
jgi:hypothetical protein